MTAADAEAQAASVLVALNVALPSGRKAYDIDDVPDPLPEAYIEVMVSRRYGEYAGPSSRRTSTAWRVTTRSVAHRSVTNVRQMHKLAAQTLEGARLGVGGVLTGPIQFETEDPVGPDGDSREWFSGLISWTYTHGGKPHA